MRSSRKVIFWKYAALYIGILIIAFPMYITVNISFKTQHEAAKSFFRLPEQLYWGNFVQIVANDKLLTYTLNSIMITISSLALMMIVLPMLSYAISRNFNKMYYKFLFYFIISGIFVPFQAIMLPLYKHMGNLSLLNLSGLVVQYVTFSLAQGIFLCVGHLKTIPLELDEASKIDGCGTWKTFVMIIYPLMAPILITIVVLNTLWIWNDFQLPLIMLNRSSDYWTLPLFIYNFRGEYTFNYPVIFAGFLLTIIPVMILYFFLQKRLIGGLVEGAIK